MSQYGIDGTEQHPTSKEEIGFHQEIACMMHGFGDNPEPNDASVAFVESIVLQQMKLMVHEAAKASEKRGGKVISNIDIIFLFRNNKIKLKRLYDYFNTISMVKQHKMNADSALLDDEENAPVPITRYGGRLTTLDIITNLDTTGEIKAIDFDAGKYIRMARVAKFTESMPLNKYEAFCKARTVSFGKPSFQKTQTKFKEWLNMGNEYNIGSTAYDILVYLAFETVAEIVDLVFLIRQDAKRKRDDPFSKFSAGNFCNPGSLNNSVYIKSGHEGVATISVAEIREAMRRVYAPRIGVTGMFYRNMRTELPPKFIAI